MPARTGAERQPYRTDIPLEALVEREPVQRTGDPRRDLRLAAEAGLYFLELLEHFKVTAAGRQAYVAAPTLALTAPPDDRDRAGARYLGLMAGRVPDGLRVYEALRPTVRPKAGKAPKLPPRPKLSAADRAKALKAAIAYLDWFDARYSVAPAGDKRSVGAGRLDLGADGVLLRRLGANSVATKSRLRRPSIRAARSSGTRSTSTLP